MKSYEIGEIFTISDDSDEQQEVEVIAEISLDDSDYVAVSFVEDLQKQTTEDIDIFFLKIDEDGDFDAIESDEEFDKVSAAFDELLQE
ncbi:DUF1292 domain-containing protein [Caldibacillus lycopersici]|uniref:DUF1292 domain-containing protein n=1 Tax=Perspicuibacillus lycopersici TaxID=1325689 RepID=A0AAE3IWE1_9BACI|nr:DUF1292 domain-containing protein [Perspicuibacillus lycopersici]MCU9614823.1 DUF1292 domain-containing protein [Perspicuibacillus lycopersici]